MDEIEDSYRRYEREPRVIVDQNLLKVRNKALALLKWRAKLPADKILEYEAILRDHLKLSDSSTEITSEQLQQATKIVYRKDNPNYVPGPEIIVKSLKGDEQNISAFVRGWRQHFLETMHPRFLPIGWSIDSPVTCGSDW